MTMNGRSLVVGSGHFFPVAFLRILADISLGHDHRISVSLPGPNSQAEQFCSKHNIPLSGESHLAVMPSTLLSEPRIKSVISYAACFKKLMNFLDSLPDTTSHLSRHIAAGSYGMAFACMAHQETAEIMKETIEKLNPSLIWAMDDLTSSSHFLQSWIRAGHARNIPMVLVKKKAAGDAHLFFYPHLFQYQVIVSSNLLIPPTPRHNSLLRDRLSIRPDDTVLLLATRPMDHNFLEGLTRRIVHCVQNHTRAHLLLRPHPEEDPGRYRDWTGSLLKARVVPDHDLSELLGITDICVSPFSSVSFQAMHMGIPTLLVEGGRPVDFMSCPEKEWALLCPAPESIPDILEKILEDQGLRKSIKEQLRNNLGCTPGEIRAEVSRILNKASQASSQHVQ